jgi:uncharacterized membrane protein
MSDLINWLPSIPADNHMAVMAALFVIAGAGFLMEKTRIGALLTGAVWAIAFAILASNLGIIPSSADAYDFVWTYFVPLLIPLFLMKADLKKIFFETTRMAGAFMLAALGTAVGAIIAFSLVDIGSYPAGVEVGEFTRQAGAVGMFTATYIGGSVNYAALIETTGMGVNDPSFVSAATAVDSLYSGFFLALLAVIPGWNWLAKKFVQIDHSEESETDKVEMESGKVTAASLTYSAAFALIVVALGNYLTAQLAEIFPADASKWRFAIISALALIPATAMPKLMSKLHGGYELGIGLSFVFFAMIAAGADVVTLMEQAPVLILIIGIMLTVHAVITFGLGAVFKLSLPELITASNAAILGATTAPALAAAKGWKGLVTPGVLVGVLGYAIGTFIATLVADLWPIF